ncbi:uncharacterized protein LOC123527810 isoform X2 [Mercenaria mercenaria]|uniref:uncharacterized protein LOC123527810 isoform X2 n=1 Tax=Mercenaria mercenaria TaxID=6596 RepID=UPI00234F4B98|nr:uncharacterized protein LOC123527810 isoform X2 [Mercenaria mercenaria]
MTMMTVEISPRWFRISLSLATVLVTCCFGSPTLDQRYERALSNHIPTTTKGSNSVNEEKDKYFKEFWYQKNGGLCPFGQVLQRNNSVCCYVAVCDPGYEIEECRVNGTEDKCSKCKIGFLQLHNISSLNMKDAKCFSKVPNHEYCPLEDMRPARNVMHKDNFPLECECRLEICYIEDDVGTCPKKPVCEPSFQLNKSGKCEPCPWYGYKNVSGCEPCTINATLLRQGKPGGVFIPPNLRTTTVKIEVKSDNGMNENLSLATPDSPRKESKNGLNTAVIILLAVIAVAVVGSMVFGVIFCYRNRMLSGSQNPPSTPSADIAPLLPGQGIPTPTHQNGYGNIPYQRNNQTLIPHGENYTNNVLNGHVRNDHVWNLNFNHNLMDGRENVNGAVGNNQIVSEREHAISTEDSINGNVQSARTVNNLGQMTGDKGLKINVPQTAPAQKKQNKSEQRQDAIKESAVESHQGAVGGIYDNSCDKKVEDESKVSKDKKKNRDKTNTKVSVHNNTFEKCKIYFGNPKSKPRNDVNVENCVEENSMSGTFVLASSCSSSDINSVPTMELTEQRDINKSKESASNGTSLIDAVDEPTNRDELKEIRGNDEPPCRPELSNSPGCDIRPVEDMRSGDVGRNGAVEKDRKHKTETVEDEKSLNPSPQKIAGTVAPLQPSAPRERPTARVPPIRQISEVRHVSGYPSERLDNDTSNGVDSFNSMSYAVMHANSELSNGFMEDIANQDDLTEIGDNEDQFQSVILDSMLNHGGGSQNTTRGNGCGQTSDVQRSQNAVPPIRRDVNRVGVTNSVPPMVEREGPEGNSITYTPEYDNYVSRPDMQETDRKVAVDDIDLDITQEKQAGNNHTSAKTVDSDDDLTEYKRKLKETQNIESDTDLKKTVDGEGNISVSEESFEIDKNYVEDILYEETETTEGKNSVNEVNTDEETSFEVDSADIKNIENSEMASCDRTKRDVIDSADMSQSFEIDSKDFKTSEKLNAEGSNVLDKNAVELDKTDTEQIVKDEELSRPVTEESIEVCSDNLTSSGDSSFEINSSEIGFLNPRGNADAGEACDRTVDGSESVAVRTKFGGDSQNSSMKSGDEVSDSGEDN